MDDRILLAHGSGGKLSHELVEKKLLPFLANPALNKLDDSAIFEASGRLAFTTDGYVVNPIFFPRYRKAGRLRYGERLIYEWS